MSKADLQRISHMRRYCKDIEGFIERFGRDYQVFITD